VHPCPIKSSMRLPDNIRFITRGWLNSNSLLLRGETPVLIDSGYATHAEHTLDLIHAHDVRVADLALVIHTHCHSDHIGGTHLIRAHAHAQTAMHPVEAAWIRAGERYLTWLDYLDQSATFFPVDRELNDGEILRVNDLTLQILHTPGHSPGGIAIFCPELEILFSGDAIWQGDMGAVNIAVHGESAFFHALASLDKLAALNARAIFPGHGKPIHDVAANFHRVRNRLNDFIAHPQKMAWHALKQYFIFWLMLKDGVPARDLETNIEHIPAFSDYATRYLDSEPRALLGRLLDELSSRGHIILRDGAWQATGPK